MPKSWDPEGPNTGKMARTAIINAIARPSLTKETGSSDSINTSWYLLENERCFYDMNEACPGDVYHLSRDQYVNVARQC